MKLKKRLHVMGKALHMELREHKSSFLVYVTLRALVIVMMILQIFNRNYENVFLCALTLVLLIMPSLIQINLKIELPTALEITILIFIFAAEILGEIQSYYIKFPFWDTVLHFHDSGRAVGIFRMCHGPVFWHGHAERHDHPRIFFRDAGSDAQQYSGSCGEHH